MPELFDEQLFTPWAEPGWTAPNGMSPETEVCEFFASLVRMLRPELVVETGMGQGYVTRAIIPVLGDGKLWCFESDDDWRGRWRSATGNVKLSAAKTPSGKMLSRADLCFFDSDVPVRLGEVELWDTVAKPGAVALIHDTGEHHSEGTHHHAIRELITSRWMTGVFLKNPRGSFLAVKQ